MLLFAIAFCASAVSLSAQGGRKAEPNRIIVGDSVTTVRGSLANGQEMEYVFAAKAGSQLTIKNSRPSAFDFRVFSEEADLETEFESSPTLTLTLPQDGDYFFFIRKKAGGPRRANFRLTLHLSPKAPVAVNTNGSGGPCWFTATNGFDVTPPEVIKARQDREMNGYPSAISLDEAVSIFNAEQKCHPRSGMPLSAKEVIVAVSTSVDHGSEKLAADWKDAISSIVSRNVLPKGSLLVGASTGKLIPISGSPFYEFSEAGPRINRIYLFLSLDKKPRLEGIDRSQIILLRKVMID